jgi:hypothetical protein
MSRSLFVVFSDQEDQGARFREACGALWNQFTAQEGSNIIFVSAQGKSLEPQNSWDLVMVWDYGYEGEKALEQIASRLHSRMQALVSQGRCVGLIQHSADNIEIQKEKFVLAPHCNRYTHQKGNPVYEAVAVVLQAVDTSDAAYQAALRKLFALVFSPYELAIDILVAFLPPDLEWQISSGQEAKACIPDESEIQGKYNRFKELAGAFGVTDFGEVDKYLWNSSGSPGEEYLFQYLPSNPPAFHKTYEDMRDALLKIVDAVEPRGGGNPA